MVSSPPVGGETQPIIRMVELLPGRSAPYHRRVHPLRRLVEAFTFEIDLWTKLN